MVQTSAVVTFRLKSPESVLEKLVRKGYKLEQLNDLIGFRITAQSVNAVNTLAELVQADTKNFEVIEKECYGVCPEEKDKYRMKSGYRSIHFTLKIKEGNKTMELQMRTPYMNMFSDWNHDFIYKGPKEIKKDKSSRVHSMEMAEYFWKLDDVRNIVPSCPDILAKANPMEILKQGVASDHADEYFKKLGSPPSACFWWNDMKLALPLEKCDKPETPTEIDEKKIEQGLIWV